MADPRFVFTGEVPARQLISSWQIDQANREGQRQQLAEIARNRNQQEQTGNQRLIAQAQLAEQMRQHDMANNQFAQEIEARKALQAAQIAGQKDLMTQQLGLYDKYPQLLQQKGMGETVMALNQGIADRNDDAETEASKLNQAIAALDKQKEIDLSGITGHNAFSRNVLRGRGIWNPTTEEQMNQREAQYQADLSNLAKMAAKSVYDQKLHRFVPKVRTPIGAAALGASVNPAAGTVPTIGINDQLAAIKSDFDNGIIDQDEAIARYNLFTGR